MKKTATAAIGLVLAIAASASAQTAIKGVGCMGPHPGAADHWNQACDGRAACDAVMADHNARWHSGRSVATTTTSRPRTPAAIVATAPIVGGLTGALLGSLATSASGKEQWQNGALGGAGAMTVVAVMANANKVNPVVGAAMATGGGAAAGTAWARYQIEQGQPDTTARDTAIGAGAGLAGWAIGAVTGGSSPQWSPRIGGRTVRLDLVAGPRLTGLRMRW